MTEELLEPTAAGRRPVPLPLQHSVPARLTAFQRGYLRVRRLLEAVAAVTALVLVSLPMALIALGVLVSMGRPVLFTQERITEGGRIFRLRKFRSMRSPVPGEELDDADRLVPFGRFLRSTSLDELPSLLNIARGDMSLVGPRPLTTDYIGRFSAEQFARHAVPAGLTGYAQVSGRNALGWDDRLALDLRYVDTVGPLLDLRILLSTVTTVLSRHGVTDEGGVTMSDFPGPQSTSELAIEGPGEDGSWQIRTVAGATVLAGAAHVLEEELATLEIHLGPRAQDGDPAQLDEAILLLVSRLRAVHRIEWGALLPQDAVPDEQLSAALQRAGFVAPDPAVRFPTSTPPPLAADCRALSLIAFLGLPDEGSAPPHQIPDDLLRRDR